MPYLSFDRNERRLLTMTLGPTRMFYQALATDLGRPGDCATDAEVQEYLRDVLKQNMDHIVETHATKPKPTLTIRRRPKL